MTAGTQEPAGFWIMYPVMSSLITCLLTDVQQVASFSPADTTNTQSHLLSLSLSFSINLCLNLLRSLSLSLPMGPDWTSAASTTTSATVRLKCRVIAAVRCYDDALLLLLLHSVCELLSDGLTGSSDILSSEKQKRHLRLHPRPTSLPLLLNGSMSDTAWLLFPWSECHLLQGGTTFFMDVSREAHVVYCQKVKSAFPDLLGFFIHLFIIHREKSLENFKLLGKWQRRRKRSWPLG